MTRVSILPLSAVLCVMSACAAEVPPVPGPESWTFKAELAEPVAYRQMPDWIVTGSANMENAKPKGL